MIRSEHINRVCRFISLSIMHRSFCRVCASIFSAPFVHEYKRFPGNICHNASTRLGRGFSDAGGTGGGIRERRGAAVHGAERRFFLVLGEQYWLFEVMWEPVAVGVTTILPWMGMDVYIQHGLFHCRLLQWSKREFAERKVCAFLYADPEESCGDGNRWTLLAAWTCTEGLQQRCSSRLALSRRIQKT